MVALALEKFAPGRVIRRGTEPLEIDWSHPLTRGLRFAWLGGIHELVSGHKGVINGTGGGLVASRYGRIFEGDGSGCSLEFQDTDRQEWLEPDELSVYILVYPNTVSQQRNYFRHAEVDDRLVVRNWTDGNLEAYIAQGWPATHGRGSATFAITANAWNGIHINWDGSTSRAYKNGALGATQAHSVTLDNEPDGGPLTIGDGSTVNSATSLNGYVAAVLMWSRALQTPAMRSVHANPWQIARPARRFFAFKADGGSTVSPADISQVQALEAPSLTQTHVLQPADLAQVQALDAPSVTQDHQLGPSEIAHVQALDAPSVTEEHQIAPGEIAQVQALESAGLTQDHQLAPAELAQLQAMDAPTLTQTHVLAAIDMAQLQSLEAVSLIVQGTVSPQDVAQVQQLGAVVLTQDHQLAVADLAQLQALESPSTSQTVTVAPQDLAQLQNLEQVTLVVTGTLTPLTAVQQQAFEAGQITQTHLLSPSDISQLQVLGGPSAGVAGYLVVSSIRILPALDADVSALPALDADASVLPALKGTVSVKPH